MSDAKVTSNWEKKLKEDTESGAENTVISPVTHGVAAVGAALVGCGLYRTAEMAAKSCPFVTMLHIGPLAAHFGTQCWVTFVGGIIMFRTLPRHLFGQLQSYMFPAYFNFGMAMNSLSLATFLFMHPRGSWGASEKTQLMALGTAFLSSLLSAYVVTPQNVRIMWEMYKVEQELGTGMEVGLHYPDKKEHPQFAQHHNKFMRWHGVSAITNLVGFVANGMHLWYIATNLRI